MQSDTFLSIHILIVNKLRLMPDITKKTKYYSNTQRKKRSKLFFNKKKVIKKI